MCPNATLHKTLCRCRDVVSYALKSVTQSSHMIIAIFSSMKMTMICHNHNIIILTKDVNAKNIILAALQIVIRKIILL